MDGLREERPREFEERGHVGVVAGEAERDPHCAAALVVDAAPELVVGHPVVRAREALRDLAGRQPQRDLPGARVAEAAAANRDAALGGAALDQLVIDEVAPRRRGS